MSSSSKKPERASFKRKGTLKGGGKKSSCKIIFTVGFFVVLIGAYFMQKHKYQFLSYNAQIASKMDEAFEYSLDYAMLDYAKKSAEVFIEMKVEEMIGVVVEA